MPFTVEIPPDIFSQNCLESLPESDPSQDDQQEYVPLSQLILPEVHGTHLESADGDQLSPLAIKPELEECDTQEQRDIFRYCRFLSAVPYTEYVGRRLECILGGGGGKDASAESRSGFLQQWSQPRFPGSRT